VRICVPRVSVQIDCLIFKKSVPEREINIVYSDVTNVDIIEALVGSRELLIVQDRFLIN